MKFLRLASKVFNRLKKSSSKKSSSDGEETTTSSDISKKMLSLLLGGGAGCLSFSIASAFIVIITVLIFLDIIKVEDSSGSTGISSGSSISYNDTCDFEDTMVTVMDYSNTTVLATVSLEDYVIGCAVFEIGASNGAYSSLNENYVKAQYLASKTWLLSTKSYSATDKVVTVRAATYDQQWCDLEKGCYVEDLTGSVKGLYAAYPGGYNGKSATHYLTESDLETARQYYNDTYGELYLPSSYNDVIESLNSSTATYYVDVTQNFWKRTASNGSLYDDVLIATGENSGKVGYTSWNTDISQYYSNKVIYKLSNYCSATTSNSSGGDISGAEYQEGGLPIPSYYQEDYADVYLSSDHVKTVATSGCGFTSSAMIISYLTGEMVTPREFVDTWSLPYYSYGKGMDFNLPQAAATHYGLGSVKTTNDINTVYEALKDGHPVMSSQGPGLFTTGQHLIVLRGVTSDGKILVNDPLKSHAIGKDYNNRKFTLEEINQSAITYFIWPKKGG